MNIQVNSLKFQDNRLKFYTQNLKIEDNRLNVYTQNLNIEDIRLKVYTQPFKLRGKRVKVDAFMFNPFRVAISIYYFTLPRVAPAVIERFDHFVVDVKVYLIMKRS